MLAVISCLFNPAGFTSTGLKYQQFRRYLRADHVTMVELSWNGHFECSDSIAIPGADYHILWQKERLLNIALQQLPPAFDKVAWIDADLLFHNPDWYAQTEQALDQFPVVQLFESVINLDANRRVLDNKPSWGAAIMSAASPHASSHHVGHAWAARREILESGFYDRMVTGGADWFMGNAWLGRFENMPLGTLSNALEDDYRRWAKRQHNLVGGNIGCVRGRIFHFFHGSLRDRRYSERFEPLLHYDFDPTCDIGIDESGLWKWTSEKPELHAAVREYFFARNEDSEQVRTRRSRVNTMSDAEFSVLEGYLTRGRHLLEFGMGESTCFALEIPTIQSVDTVETSEEFATQFLRYHPKLATQIESGRLQLHRADIGETRHWGYPKYQTDRWSNYLKSCEGINRSIDLVLIDGRFRVASLAQSILLFPQTKAVAFHDFWNRSHYHEALSCFEALEVADSMAILRPKADCSCQELIDLRDRFLNDPR